jgi:uncharacterized protein (TIGR02246 family)
MRKPLSSVVALTVIIACQQPPAQSAALAEADVSAIRDASAAFVKAVQDTAWDTWANFYTDDALFMPPNGPAVSGHAALVAFARGFPPFTDFNIRQVDVDGRGDVAYVYGRYSWVLTMPGAAAMPDSGKFIEIWRKQGDGTWKITRDIFNSDVPLPAPPPTR